MSKLKICVYAIAKNEEMFVQRFVEAASDADLILVGDTGSTDSTLKLIQGGVFPGLKAREDDPLCQRCLGVSIHVKPWRFDFARDAVLAMIPSDVDVCVSLDLDEVLQPGWREEIERVWIKGQTTRLRYMFDWGLGIAFKYEKIHARDGYRWHHPCHEYPMPYGIEEVWADTDMLLVVHKPDPTKSRAQYLPLLRMSVEEDPHCPRNAFYYARELSFYDKNEEAIREAQRYLALPRATWKNERAYAYRVIAKCQEKLGQPGAAEMSFLQAITEAPNTREPKCELAALMYRQSRWSECFVWSMATLAITDREKVYTVDPDVWGARPHDYASISAWQLGMKDVALEQVRKALELSPDDPRLLDNLAWMDGSKVC